MDCARRRLVAPGDVRVELTMAEFNLLHDLRRAAPQRVLTRDQLIELAGGDSDYAFDRSIDILVSRLRRKMEDGPARTPKLILTVRSGGYQFLPEDDLRMRRFLPQTLPVWVLLIVIAGLLISQVATLYIVSRDRAAANDVGRPLPAQRSRLFAGRS